MIVIIVLMMMIIDHEMMLVHVNNVDLMIKDRDNYGDNKYGVLLSS